MDDDRISDLPQPILHRILCFLYTEEAVRTSVLSKSWRHLWSTRPNFTLSQIPFNRNIQPFMHVLDTTLQGYHDQNHCIHEFHVELSTIDAASILQKWIPIVVRKMRVQDFGLTYDNLDYTDTEYFDLPSVVFESQYLHDISLEGCDLSRVDSTDRLPLNNLKRLSLIGVRVDDRTFDKIISGCPLLEYLSLETCVGLTNVKLINKAHNLKVFDFDWDNKGYANTSIEIDVPSIEKISIGSCLNWSHHRNHFGHLKSLDLECVRLSTKSFCSFSLNFPSVEKLSLRSCYGFKRIQLSSASIKSLSVTGVREEAKIVAIDAPNIVDFCYGGRLPRFFSFTTASCAWRSRIHFGINNDPAWLMTLKEFLKALSRSKISLHINGEDIRGIIGCRFYKPVSVEDLELKVSGQSSSSLSGFINGLFRIFRPTKIRGCLYYEKEADAWRRKSNQFTEIMWKTLLTKGEDGEMSDWKRRLEEAILEASDYDEVEWRRVDAPSLLEPRAALLQNNYANHNHLRFRLTWRGN